MSNIEIDKLVEQYPNDMELGGKIREMYWGNKKIQEASSDKQPWIYESPDNGKTITRRRLGADLATKETISSKMKKELFGNE